MPSILEETHNLLTLYLHAIGPLEVPRNYLKWAFISLVAALVGNRVWVNKLGLKLPPNLYINLLGPSATGKDTAVDKAMSLVVGDERLEKRLNYYNGTASYQKLFQRMTRKNLDADGVPHAQLYLLTPELAYALGQGETADGFIKFMTALYTGKDYTVERDTITGGNFKLRHHCLNWISGSTVSWFPFQSLEGGFIGRIMMVEGGYPTERHFDPQPPPDAPEVMGFLKEQLARRAWLAGEFEKTPEAAHVEETWYLTRPLPKDPALMPMHRRGHDLVLKLAMVFSLMQSNRLVILPHHIETAIALAKESLEALPHLAAFMNANTLQAKHMLWVETYLREHGRVMRSRLTHDFSSQGGNAMELDQIMRTLEQGRKATHSIEGRAIWYKWADRKILPVDIIPRLPDEP